MVRGVNLGGWLVLERYITPYQFAITDCHLRGDFCWYPGQISAPKQQAQPQQPQRSNSSSSDKNDEYQLCDLYQCRPHRTAVIDSNSNDSNDDSSNNNDNPPVKYDYPMDEYSLAQAFGEHRHTHGAAWLDYHFDNFLSEDDLRAVKDSGLTHVRVPLPHWILGFDDENENDENDKPWIVGHRWEYFVRLLGWCRRIGLQVWPDLHTAPGGSQNGFDNSGRSGPVTCQGWSSHPAHVQRTLDVLDQITRRIAAEGYAGDVVTGFGLLNEPFKDCDRAVYEAFLEQGLDTVRGNLGPDTAVYVSDMFLAKTFHHHNHWWKNINSNNRYNHTYLDSHYYHVFAQEPRALSPRQHIAYVCQNEYRDVISCCGNNNNNAASGGVQRLVGEWSAAVDKLPAALLDAIMESIATTGMAPQLDRQLSAQRADFLRHFAAAQMVSYERGAQGWFYWTAKMEGGAFAEWDYLRAVRNGWFPKVPADPAVAAEELHGSCYDIIFQTNDTMDVIHEFPDPDSLPVNHWPVVIDDDVVLSHGDSLLNVNGHYMEPQRYGRGGLVTYSLWILAGLFAGALWRFFYCGQGIRNRRKEYTEIATDEDEHHMTL